MIHPTAIVDPSATVAPDCEIGAYSIVGPDVSIGSGCKLHSHVVVKGPCSMGCNNEIFQFSSIGEAPQDLKFNGEDTRLEIASSCRILTAFLRHDLTSSSGVADA